MSERGELAQSNDKRAPFRVNIGSKENSSAEMGTTSTFTNDTKALLLLPPSAWPLNPLCAFSVDDTKSTEEEAGLGGRKEVGLANTAAHLDMVLLCASR